VDGCSPGLFFKTVFCARMDLIWLGNKDSNLD
jgi:hypothetical protein